MPLYAVECECGGREAFSSLIDRVHNDGLVPCAECGELVAVRVAPARVIGLREIDVPGVGTFGSARALDAYAESKGLVVVTPGDSYGRAVAERNRNAGDAEARARGFRDLEDQTTTIRNNHRDMVAAAREKKIAQYHDEHGTDGKQGADGEVFGPLPE